MERVEVSFDKGTVVVCGWSSFLPKARWDPRSQVYRALAMCYRDIKWYLEKWGAEVDDRVLELVGGSLGELQLPQLRDYQREALDAWMRSGCRGVIVLPTGAGKTLVAIHAIAALQKPALVVVPTIELLNQWKSVVSKSLGVRPGVIGGGERELGFVTITTYSSAYLHAEELGNKFWLLVFDEVHHLAGENLRQIAELSAAPSRMGLTATFEREDEKHVDLIELVGPVVYRKAVYEMKGRHLADFDVVRVYVELSDEEKARYSYLLSKYSEVVEKIGWTPKGPGDFKKLVAVGERSREVREALMAWREARKIAFHASAKLDLLRELLRKHRGDKVIIFTELNEAVHRISRELLIPEITHKTTMNERKEILSRFRDGVYRAIVTSRVLEEGIDVPDANVAIVLSGTGSRREFVQRLGRILRPAPGKRAVLYEVVTRGTSERWASWRRRRALKSE